MSVEGFNLQQRLEAHRQEEKRLSWEGTFGQYFEEKVSKLPQTARLSHARIYDMIMSRGTENG